MPFCENCGQRLEDGAAFCENCGTKTDGGFVFGDKTISESDVDSGFSVFADHDWRDRWLKAAQSVTGRELGIIVTRERRLVEALSMSDPAPLRECVGRYINAAKQRGVVYHYLDLELFDSNGNLRSNLSILQQIVDVARPKYLFLLGDQSVMAVGEWENQTGDSDEEVFGDLPYLLLDDTSPWDGQDFRFKDSLRVGRLPNGADDGFNSFRQYLEYAAVNIGKTAPLSPYGLSALVWEPESQAEFSHISKENVDTSPDFTIDDPNCGYQNANLLYFNLHGSEQNACWYGQDGKDYPPAFSPQLLCEVLAPNYIGVEACYGAQYGNDLETDESILLTALHCGCISFLGSSKIAYGTSEPEGTCADIIIGEYIRGIAAGKCSGDAFAAGLQKLVETSDLDDSDCKTIAEFSLYGDPSACTGKNPNISTAKSLMKGFCGVPKGLHIPMPDIRRATRLALVDVNAKISAMIDDFAKKNYLSKYGGEESFQVTSKTFRLPTLGLNQKIYSVKSSSANHFVKVYFDDNGSVKKSCCSK
ncbi:MAG: zinc ribbon domain-containing protein [Lentisphaeria bacterium]|nr:zinc ribbon domain-containing protein [Lentisphaeria bacterium]